MFENNEGNKKVQIEKKRRKKKRKNTHRKRMRMRKRDIFLRIVFCLSLLAAIFLVVFGLLIFDGAKQETSDSEEITEDVSEDILQETPEVPSEDIPETPSEDIPEEKEEEVLEEVIPVVYEEPEYEFKTEEFVIELPGISKEYTLAWVSDVHMVADTEASDDVKEEFMETVNGRFNTFKTKDEVPVNSVDLWPEIVKYLNYNKFDGIIFGGDLMDYCSRKNMDTLKAELEKLNPEVPTMYIRADHDYGYAYGGDVLTEPVAWQMHAEEIFDNDENGKKFLEFDDFMIIGINRSTKNMMPGYYDWVKMWYDNAVQREKPVLIATHVPYESKVDPSLEELSMQVRNKVYYWGGGAYVPYDDTKTFFDTMIYSEDTAVKSVLAGHLHHTWEGKLTEQVNQHIFTPAFEGCIGIIRVKPVEAE